MSAEILQLEVKWKSDISSLSYVGELALDKAELNRLCEKLGDNAFRHPLALTVLAVNCAYYYLDKDGFWTHFCSKLDVSHTSATTGLLGTQIERCLRSAGKLSRERSGPNRYVGAILEQCGITRKQLPNFVDFLRDLGKRYGWDGILGLDYARYKFEIPSIGSRYLLGFLSDGAGWEFTRDVARNLSQRDRGIIETSELERLKGYHPSFWSEVIELLKPYPLKVKSRNIPFPILAFDPSSRTIQIRLDADLIRKSMCRLDGKLLSSNYTLRKNIETDFRDSYCLEVFVDGSWLPISLQGWDPKSTDFAFFHETKGYIKDISKLKPGTYWLLSVKSKIVSGEMILSGPDTLSLIFGFFNIHEISITPETDLSAFGVSGAVFKSPYLSYVGTCKQLESSADARTVFTGKLPLIQINNFESLTNDDFILVADVGGQQRRVEKQYIHNSIIKLEELGYKLPAKGSLWLEATGRNSAHAGERIIDRLDFAVIHDCHIDGPNYLISNSEEAELELVGPDTYALELINGYRSESSSRKWQVAPNANIAEGTLNANGILIRIAYRLYRANLILPNDADTLFFENLDSGIPISVEGVPNTPLGLYLGYSKKSQKICPPASFNKTGRAEMSSFSFRDFIISNKLFAGQFEIGRPGGTVPTSSFYLDVNKACNAICSAEDESYNASWHEYLSPNHKEVFQLLYAIASKNQLPVKTPNLSALHDVINSLTSTFVACANVLDGIAVNLPGLGALKPSIRLALEWYKEASAISIDIVGLDTVRGIIERYPENADIPLDRWKSLLEHKFSELQLPIKLSENLDEIIAAWSNEVKDIRRLEYAGYIANLESGKELVDCWKLYYKNNRAEQSYHAAMRITAEGIIGELARLLAMLMLNKLKQPDEAVLLYRDNCNKFLAPFFQALSRQKVLISPQALNVIPLRDEDLILFK